MKRIFGISKYKSINIYNSKEELCKYVQYKLENTGQMLSWTTLYKKPIWWLLDVLELKRISYLDIKSKYPLYK